MIETVKLKSVLGINNRLPRHALQTDIGQFVAGATNVDLDDTGRVSRRSGFAEVATLATGRSLFSANGFTLLADGTSLKSVVDFSPYTAVTVDTVAANKISYADINGEIYYTDGVKLARLDQYGAAHPATVPVPASLSASTVAGSLPAGRYQATITYLVGSLEGGAIPSIAIELPSGGGIQLSLPAMPAGVTGINVYVSANNSEIPYLHSTVMAGPVSVTTKPTGRQCRTELHGPMPAGGIVRHLNDKLLVADGDMLYYSEPFNFGLTNPARNYVKFAADIAILRPCVGGIYVVADATYWLTGLGTPEQNLLKVLPYGACPGSDQEMPNGIAVFWLSARGVVVGDSQGQVKNLNESSLLLDLSGRGASLLVEGNNRIVASNG